MFTPATCHILFHHRSIDLVQYAPTTRVERAHLTPYPMNVHLISGLHCVAATACCLDLLNLAPLRSASLQHMKIDQVPRRFLLTPDLGGLVYPMGSSRSSFTSDVLAEGFNALWSGYWALLVMLLEL